MEDSSHKNTRKRGDQVVNSAVLRPMSVNESIAEALRGWSAKIIARRAKASQRTVESWKQAKAGPQARHMAAMMNDDELCAALLTALGRSDLATRAKMIAILKQTRDAIDGVTE